MSNYEKRLIFLLLMMIWFFFGESVCLAIWNIELGIFVGVFFLCGIAFLLKLSKTNFIKVFASYKAQRKGKMFYGYIFQIVERNKENDGIIDTVIELQKDEKKKERVKKYNNITGTLILKIVIFDDTKMETTLIEQEISTESAINENINEQQYICLYRYKDKHYILEDDCSIPKFLIPKNYRIEMKNYIDNYLSIN